MLRSKTLIIIISLLLVIIALAGVIYIKYKKNIQKNIISNDSNGSLLEDDETEKIKNYNGEDRAVAIMIDNVGNARPQAGLNDAYLVYEMIVEGEQTRLMALFKGKNLKKIGPIRSSRHYFLDYALENDAIYVHYGWSPKAKNDITSFNINNINGMVESSKSF